MGLKGEIINPGNVLITGGAISGVTISNCIGAPQTTRCTAQVDKTDTNLANITGLSQHVNVGTYQFEFHVFGQTTNTGGFKTAFNYTTAVLSALIADVAGTITTSTSAGALLFDAVSPSGTNALGSTGYGTIVVTTAGTVDLQFAEHSASGTTSVFVGSYMIFTQIA